MINAPQFLKLCQLSRALITALNKDLLKSLNYSRIWIPSNKDMHTEILKELKEKAIQNEWKHFQNTKNSRHSLFSIFSNSLGAK